jgi:hypothetical protein
MQKFAAEQQRDFGAKPWRLALVAGVVATFAATPPVYGWPLGQRLIERREARLERESEQTEMRSEVRWLRLEGAATSAASPNRFSPGMVRRLRRQGLTPEEIMALSAGRPPFAATTAGREVGAPRPVRSPEPARQQVDQIPVIAGEALPVPAGYTAKETTAAPEGDGSPESVLVGPTLPEESAAVGPRFPGMPEADLVPTKEEQSDVVVTHDPIRLLPPPTSE